jgi:hypothetical protein
MADIKVLMVLDGGRLNFGPPQTATDAEYFGVTALVDALDGSTTPTIQVDTAHRRGGTFNTQVLGQTNPQDNHENCSVGLTYPGDFVFDITILRQYDVLWIIADEGYNDGQLGTTADSPISNSEILAIATFMGENGGPAGGVFAVGDHDGIGAYMCGALPRVRIMRRWFEYDKPLQDTIGHTGQTFAPNWSAAGNGATSPMPDRNDTLQPDAQLASGNQIFCFSDQSDGVPQPLMTAADLPLTSAPALVHSILRDADGAIIGQFPDHMHEGEATDFTTVSGTGTPFNPNMAPGGQPTQVYGFEEFPKTVDGFQPFPSVIAYTHDSGHSTYGPGDTTLGMPAYGPTNAKTRGAISLYDGRPVGRGRIITGSTFHHYLDKNLLGDPGTAGTGPVTWPTGSDGPGLPTAVKQSMGQYYINAVTWLAKVNPHFQIWTLKSTFGYDEIIDAPGGFPDAFYVVVDGFHASAVNATQITFSGPFKTKATISQPGTPIVSGNLTMIPFTVQTISPSAFPHLGTDQTNELLLEARLTINNQPQAAEALFQMTAGAVPYFTNVNSQATPPNVFYLSQDLRVFQVCPGLGRVPPMVPWRANNSGYDYIQGIIKYLNDPGHGYTTGQNDPFQVLAEAGDLVEYSSVAPVDDLPGGGTTPNYNFALARVRLKGGTTTNPSTASNVRVFFRLFDTVSNDTDYDPVITYPSTPDIAGFPAKPLPGLAETTIPMFATMGGTGDFVMPPAAPLNARDLKSTGNETWAFFGCYLDIFNVMLPGTHHCLVAQIAFDGTPIINSNGITLSPENTSLLAQRNLQVTSSGNPGGPAAHRVPQTFDLRPSTRTAEPISTLAGRPDELVIDWGGIPHGSTASIYWPEAAAIDVVRLTNVLYTSNPFQAADAHTITWTVTSGLSFVPVPFGAEPKLAGLLTIDLPPGVRAGQEFHVVVRRISTRQSPVKMGATARAWRYVVGTFQINIPVNTEKHLLRAEETTLAIMKWRLEHLSRKDRWYPVLVRYLSYLESRVNAFGGNASSITPSPLG